MLCNYVATVKLPADKFAPTADMSTGPSTSSVADLSEPKKIILNSSEELFAELRDRNFHAVGPILSKKAKLISAEFDVSTLDLLLLSVCTIYCYLTIHLVIALIILDYYFILLSILNVTDYITNSNLNSRLFPKMRSMAYTLVWLQYRFSL